jgi:peptidoglycan/LPS O-acetylase OafA/YrhL
LRDTGILSTAAPLINASPFSRSLAWGVALAHLLHSEKGYNFTVRFLGSRWASLITGLLLVTILMQPGIREGWKAISTSALLACFVASIVVQPNHILSPFFRYSPVAYLGTISYGIYLYHMPVVVAVEMLCRKIGIDLWGLSFTALYLGSLTILSAVSFEYFEKPILSQRKRFTRMTMGRILDKVPKSETGTL